MSLSWALQLRAHDNSTRAKHPRKGIALGVGRERSCVDCLRSVNRYQYSKYERRTMRRCAELRHIYIDCSFFLISIVLRIIAFASCGLVFSPLSGVRKKRKEMGRVSIQHFSKTFSVPVASHYSNTNMTEENVSKLMSELRTLRSQICIGQSHR